MKCGIFVLKRGMYILVCCGLFNINGLVSSTFALDNMKDSKYRNSSFENQWLKKEKEE